MGELQSDDDHSHVAEVKERVDTVEGKPGWSPGADMDWLEGPEVLPKMDIDGDGDDGGHPSTVRTPLLQLLPIPWRTKQGNPGREWIELQYGCVMSVWGSLRL